MVAVEHVVRRRAVYEDSDRREIRLNKSENHELLRNPLRSIAYVSLPVVVIVKHVEHLVEMLFSTRALDLLVQRQVSTTSPAPSHAESRSMSHKSTSYGETPVLPLACLTLDGDRAGRSLGGKVRGARGVSKRLPAQPQVCMIPRHRIGKKKRHDHNGDFYGTQTALGLRLSSPLTNLIKTEQESIHSSQTHISSNCSISIDLRVVEVMHWQRFAQRRQSCNVHPGPTLSHFLPGMLVRQFHRIHIACRKRRWQLEG